MVEIIPSINAQTFEEAQERIAKVEPYVKWCHLDITDGVFSKHLTWHNPADLINLDTKINLEVHLMVGEPEKVIEQWLIGQVKRIIVHLEAVSDMNLIIEKCREAGVEIGLSINPETFWGKLKPWFRKVDVVHLLAVHPGPSGQEVDWPEMLDKVIHIHKTCPQCIIEIDGGINPQSAQKTVKSGVSLLVAGAYIFNSKDIKKAIGELKGSIQNLEA